MAVVVSTLRNCGALQDDYLLQLAKWHHNEWLHLNPGGTLEQRLAGYKHSVQSSALPEIFIACENKKLLGSATLAKEDMDTRKFLTPWLASLFVVPEQRNKGIASQLITFIINYAKKNGFKNLYLFTEDQTDFYRHRGWYFVETVNYRQTDVDLMCRKLD